MIQRACNQNQFIWKVTIILGLLALALGLAWPALADYLGPNRTVTTWTWERLHCQYVATYDPIGPGYYTCTLHQYDTPSGSCPATSTTPPYFNPVACVGWPGTCGSDFSCSINLTSSIDGCTGGQPGCTSTSHTNTYPPATVSGSINCSQAGNAGWCRGSASLLVSASEPVGGHTITGIEGTHNGSALPCSGVPCEVILPEGQNDFTFWAHSTFGDTSLMGNASGKLDSQPPQVGLTGAGSFCPACGESLSVSVNVSDATSGVASWALTLDGASLAGGSAAASQTVPVPSGGLAAGSHTLALSAVDVAGNTNATTLTFTLLLPTPTPTPTFTPVPTATNVPPGGNVSQGNEPASQGGSSLLLATPTLGPSVTPGDEATAIPIDEMDEEQVGVAEDTESAQFIGAGSGGGSAPLDSSMLSTMALLGTAAGGLGAMAVYTLGKNPMNLDAAPASNKYSLPLEEPNIVKVECPYIHQWTEIRPDMLVETHVGNRVEKVLVRAGFYMNGEPYTDYITKTYTKNGSSAGNKEMVITKSIPYTAYEQIWVPPVYKGIIKPIIEYRPMEIIHEETRWREIAIDGGNIPSALVKEFFKQMDPHLEFWQMEQKFKAFKETMSRLPMFVHENDSEVVGQYLGDGINMMVCINSSAYFYKMSTENIDKVLSGQTPDLGSKLWPIYRDEQVHWTGKIYQSVFGDTYLEVRWNDHGEEMLGWVNSEFLVLQPDGALSEQAGNVNYNDPRTGDIAKQYIECPFLIYLKDSRLAVNSYNSLKLTDLCGFWAVAYFAQISVTDVLRTALEYEIRVGNVKYEGYDVDGNTGKKREKYRVLANSKLYPAFTNDGTSVSFIQTLGGLVCGARTESISSVLKSGDGFQFLAGLIKDQLSQGKRLVMGVRTDGNCNLNGNAGSTHFVSVTDVYYENDCWKVRYYDPWTDSLKVAPFGTPDDFTSFCGAAAKFDNGYGGFFIG